MSTTETRRFVRIEVSIARRLFGTVVRTIAGLRRMPRPKNWQEFQDIVWLYWMLSEFHYPRPFSA